MFKNDKDEGETLKETKTYANLTRALYSNYLTFFKLTLIYIF